MKRDMASVSRETTQCLFRSSKKVGLYSSHTSAPDKHKLTENIAAIFFGFFGTEVTNAVNVVTSL